jgi:hypothetical protein
MDGARRVVRVVESDHRAVVGDPRAADRLIRRRRGQRDDGVTMTNRSRARTSPWTFTADAPPRPGSAPGRSTGRTAPQVHVLVDRDALAAGDLAKAEVLFEPGT